jgi:hypothetical protein
VLSDKESHCLLESDSEQSFSESDFETENELDDRALTDAVGNEGSDGDDSEGRAIAQAVSRQLPTAAAMVQTRVWSCGIL